MSKAQTSKIKFFAELTDTYVGEANYSWVKRFLVEAVSTHGALMKLSKETGFNFTKDYDTGDLAKYNVKGACICLFIEQAEGNEEEYNRIVNL